MLNRIMHPLMLSSHCHSSPLRLRTIMHDIKCLQKWCHRHLKMTFPVLSFFPRWELHAGGIPLALLFGDSWLWVRLAWACPSDKSGLTVRQHPLGPSFSSPFSAWGCPLPDCFLAPYLSFVLQVDHCQIRCA